MGRTDRMKEDVATVDTKQSINEDQIWKMILKPLAKTLQKIGKNSNSPRAGETNSSDNWAAVGKWQNQIV